MLPIRVLFLGPLRAQFGTEHLDITALGEITQEDLWSGLLAKYPELKTQRPTTRLARHGEFLSDTDTLRPGDEIAIIPPVSGG